MNCKSFKDVFKKMESFVERHGDNAKIFAIIEPSGINVIGKYGWKLVYQGGNIEEEFVINVETLKKNNGIEELDAMSNFLLDPNSLLSLLRHVTEDFDPKEVKSQEEEDFIRKELQFLARIDHLKTIKK